MTPHGACARCRTLCWTASDLCAGCAGHEAVYALERRASTRVRPEVIAIAAGVVLVALLWVVS